MSGLLSNISKFLNCDVSELSEKLKDNKVRRDVEKFLQKECIQTNYHKDSEREVYVAELTKNLNAYNAYAYNGKKGITVDQHYYAKHRIDLKFPMLPLVIQRINGHRSFYPLELLEIYKPEKYFCENCGHPNC